MDALGKTITAFFYYQLDQDQDQDRGQVGLVPKDIGTSNLHLPFFEIQLYLQQVVFQDCETKLVLNMKVLMCLLYIQTSA